VLNNNTTQTDKCLVVLGGGGAPISDLGMTVVIDVSPCTLHSVL